MKKPNFIIAGFPKCGTTSLHHYLGEHPEIYMPAQKELHFFTCNILSKLNKGPKDTIVKKTQINLDIYCRRKGISPDIIKIDAEGSEIEILKGQESFRVKSFIKSNIWALLPAGKSKFKKGEIVDCFFPNQYNQTLI